MEPGVPTSADKPEPCETLDLRGLKCPLPVLHTRRTLAKLPPGAVLDVRCTDPLAELDIPNLVRETGNRLVAEMRGAAEIRFRILKAPQPCPGAAPREDPSASASVDIL